MELVSLVMVLVTKKNLTQSLLLAIPHYLSNEGVILPWNKNNQFYQELTKEVARHCSINPNQKWEDLTEEKKTKVIFGDNKMINILTITQVGITAKNLME